MTKKDRVDQMPETRANLRSRTEALARFVARTDYGDLPPRVVSDTKRLILDTVACACAGRDLEAARINRDVALMLGGLPQASIVGQAAKTSMPLAGMVNAKMANVLDLDDCFMNVAHFSPQAVFAALAAGECAGVSGRRLISGVAVGYDVAARICLSFNFWRVRRGTITTLGSRQVYAANAFAAMAAAAHGLGLGLAQARNAFGNCGHFAPVLTRSIMPVHPPDEMNKYCDAGWSTHAGIMAAIFGQKGCRSTHFALDGRDGYAAVMGIDAPDQERLTVGLGRTWHISDAALKTNPCCKYVHTPLQVFAGLVRRHRIAPKDIRRVNVYLRPSHAVGFSRQELPADLKMPFTHNIPFNLAQAAFGRKPNAEWHRTAHLKDPKVTALMKRIFTYPCGAALTVGVEDVPVYGYPREIATRVEIVAGGKTFAAEARRAKGDPWWSETRFSDADLLRKLKLGCEAGLSRSDTERLFETIMDLERVKNVGPIGDIVRKFRE